MNYTRTLTLALLALLPMTAVAQGTKIAVVNMQTVMRDSAAAKSMRSQLEAKQKSIQGEVSKQEQALQKEEQELAKQQSTLAKEAFEEKVKAYRTKVGGMQKDVQGKKLMLDRAYEQSVTQIQKTVSEIIAGMAKEKGFQAAMHSMQMLYAEPDMDITNEVMTQLNSKLPSVTVKFEAAPAADKK